TGQRWVAEGAPVVRLAAVPACQGAGGDANRPRRAPVGPVPGAGSRDGSGGEEALDGPVGTVAMQRFQCFAVRRGEPLVLDEVTEDLTIAQEGQRVLALGECRGVQPLGEPVDD